MAIYQTLTKWSDIGESLGINPFTAHADFLETLGLTPSDALDMLYMDYYDAYAITDDPNDVQRIINMVILANRKKYDALVDAFPFSQLKRRVRTPDITREVEASSSGSADVQRNQVETQTESPRNYGQTRSHSVAPFDSQTTKMEYEDSITNTGSRDVETRYTGNPDHTASQSSGSRTDTETGTETITESVIGSDKLTMAEAMQDMAEAASLWKIVEMDIAAKLFVQVWR